MPQVLNLKYFLLILVVVAQCTSVKAQSIASLEDSLQIKPSLERIHYIHQIINKIDPYKQKNKILSLLEKIKLFAEKENDKTLLKEFYFIDKTKQAYWKGDALKRLNIYKKALIEYQNEPRYKAICLHHISQNQFVLEKYDLGFENLLKAQKIFKSHGFKKFPNIGKYLHDSALDFYFFKNYSEVIRLMRLSFLLPDFSENLNIQRYNTLGLALQNQGKLDSAMVNLKKAKQKATLYNDTIWKAITTGNIAEVLYLQKKYTAALHLFLKSYAYAIKTEAYPLIKKDACTNIAKVYLKLNLLNDAKKYINLADSYSPVKKTFQFGEKQQFELANKQYYANQYQYSKKTNNFKAATYYLDSLSQAKKLESNKYNAALVSLFRSKFKNQEHLRAIANQEKEKAQLKLRYSIVISTVSLIAIVGYMLFYYVRISKRKQSEILLTKQKLAKIEQEKTEEALKQAKSNLIDFIEQIDSKNKLITNVSKELKKVKSNYAVEKNAVKQTLNKLRESTILTKSDWIDFQANFNKVYPFFKQNTLHYCTAITESELRYLMLVKLGLSHHEIAQAIGVLPSTVRVTWNRIRKKTDKTLKDSPLDLIKEIDQLQVTHRD